MGKGKTQTFLWMQNFWFLAFIYLFSYLFIYLFSYLFIYLFIYSKFYHEGYFICLNVFHFFGDKLLKKRVK